MNDKALTPDLTAYYNEQFNTRARIPDYAGILTRWKEESVHVRRRQGGLFDLHFGDAAEERLDLFPARQPGAPLLVFIHGGWFRALDKSDFSFLVPAWRQAGFSVALPNYTLAPAATIEEIVLQQLRALAWLYRNAQRYDIDPGRIAVAGHSAGAHLAAMMMAARWPLFGEDLPMDLVKAGVLLSGVYDMEPVRHADFLNVDLKLGPEHMASLSPAFMTPSHPARFITAVGGLESEEFQRQNRLIADQWRAGHVADVPLSGVHHLGICDEFGNAESPLFRASLDLMKGM